MKKIRQERGSITLFVLIAMLFFMLFIAGMYMLSANKEATGLAETARIKEIYEKDLNQIDDVYETLIQESKQDLDKIAKVGDYVKYNTGKNGTILCRVLYDATSEYGLQIISNKSVKTVSLGGATWEEAKESYNNVITTLNNEAMIFLNNTYAMDARSVGSNPINKNKEEITTVILPLSQWNEYKRPTNWTTDDTGCKEGDSNSAIDFEIMKKNGMLGVGENYWLASRSIGVDSYICNFNVSYITNEEIVQGYYLCNVRNTGLTNGNETISYGFRPCITLKSGLKVIDGDGKTEQTAYEILI